MGEGKGSKKRGQLREFVEAPTRPAMPGLIGYGPDGTLQDFPDPRASEDQGRAATAVAGPSGASPGAVGSPDEPAAGRTTMQDQGELAVTISGDRAVSGSGDLLPPDTPPPEVIARRYRVTDLIGAGGFGAVYKAIDQRLDKTVAVKVLNSQRARSPSAIKRFRAEALAASRLAHPGIVAVTDFDLLADGRPFLVMEYVQGETLEQLLERVGPLPVERAARIAHAICLALAAAHEQHVVHRDLKPANIIIGRRDTDPLVKILDFGVAKLREQAGAENLTGAGNVVGTPAYMAPEQVREILGPVDGRTDLYALGMVLYETVAGVTPFAGRPVTDVLLAQVMEEIEPLSRHRPDVPRALEEIITRATQKKPEKRYQAPVDMALALMEFISHRSQAAVVRRPSSRRWLGALLAGVGLVALGVGGWLMLRRSPAATVGAPPAETRAGEAPPAPPAGAEPEGSPARAGATPASAPVAAASAPAVAATPGGPASAPAPAAAVPADAAPRAVAAPAKRRRLGRAARRRGHGSSRRGGRKTVLPDSPMTKFRVPQ